MQMDSLQKILIVDKTDDRKTRIAAIKARGFAVYPALNLQEARSRCRPGAYDLVVVNGTVEPEACVAFCDQLRERKPKQPVLLTVDDHASVPDRDYLVDNNAAELAGRVEALLRKPSAADTSNEPHREEMPARAVA
jgi:DNA-binding response OmpR family regulator